MKERKLTDFLKGYMEFCKNSESPVSYHTWSALSCIASALERKVWMKWGHSEIYANLYIVLIGPSGVRKGEPIVIARSLLQDIGTELVSESITKEALIRRMKNAIKNFDAPDSGSLDLRFQCAVSVIAEELAVFLGDSDTRFLADLTNWYDSRDKWVYETKHGGIDEVIGVCLNVLASMAPDWIPTTIPMGAIGGGFTSRIIFIVEHKKAKVITNPNLIGVDEELRDNLLHDLEIINSLVGEFSFDEPSLEAYERWYATEEVKVAKGRPAIADSRFGGYNSRRATHIKKLAMVCSASHSDRLIITRADFNRAIQLLTHAERSMPEVFGRVGLSSYAEQTAMVMEIVKELKKVSKNDVQRRLYRDIDERTLEIVQSTLEISGFIKVNINTETGRTVYEWLG